MAREARVALVTGAGRRVGRRVALALGEAGYDVVVHYGSSSNGAEEVVGELRRGGRRGWAIGADLADAGAIERLFSAIDERIGRLDVLVNSAALFERRPIDEVRARDWERTLAVNLRAPFLCTQLAARRMRRNDTGGCVVNLVDLSATTPWLGYAVHGVSKAGLAYLTRAAARELGPRVRVNAVAPGAILPPPGEEAASEAWRRRGDRLPLGRTGDPADVAQAVLFLVAAEYVTGVVLPVDGGEHLGPARGGSEDESGAAE